MRRISSPCAAMSERASPSSRSSTRARRTKRWRSCSVVKPMPASTCWQWRATMRALRPAIALAIAAPSGVPSSHAGVGGGVGGLDRDVRLRQPVPHRLEGRRSAGRTGCARRRGRARAAASSATRRPARGRGRAARRRARRRSARSRHRPPRRGPGRDRCRSIGRSSAGTSTVPPQRPPTGTEPDPSPTRPGSTTPRAGSAPDRARRSTWWSADDVAPARPCASNSTDTAARRSGPGVAPAEPLEGGVERRAAGSSSESAERLGEERALLAVHHHDADGPILETTFFDR